MLLQLKLREERRQDLLNQARTGVSAIPPVVPKSAF
jgi:hypothetical protein